MSRSAMSGDRSISELAAEAGVTYSAMWKRMNPERARAIWRADNAKRPDRDRADRGTCPRCGGPKAAARFGDLCRACAAERDRQPRDERCRLIEQWWAEGLSMQEIATRLGWVRNTFAKELNWMRRNDYDVPYRHRYPARRA